MVQGIRGMIARSEDLKGILYKRYGDKGLENWDELEFVMIDLRDAFCHLAIDPREWRHTVTPDEAEVGALVWPAMLFGYKAAPLHMGRLASAIGRVLQSMVSAAEMTSQIYMDDIILVLRGPRKHRNHVPCHGALHPPNLGGADCVGKRRAGIQSEVDRHHA